jgi:thiamine pyrophosphate-dependent acetolactate synthase large subunit-like protein
MAETAADILIHTLVNEWGVRHIFSLPGDGICESMRTRQD